MKASFKASLTGFIFALIGVLASAFWDRPIEGAFVIGLGTIMLATSFVCESLEAKR